MTNPREEYLFDLYEDAQYQGTLVHTTDETLELMQEVYLLDGVYWRFFIKHNYVYDFKCLGRTFNAND
jgi:hypothetical protein